jgi:aspartyl protease family protein
MNRLVTRALSITFLMTLAAWALASRAPVTPAPMPDALQQTSTNPWSNAPPPQTVDAPPHEPKVITRDRTGQFHLDGFINGQQTRFLVDTGADLVAIPDYQAAQLGITVRPDAFRPMLQTASGTADGAAVELDRLDVAGASLTHVHAVVVRGLETILLGQSALKRLGTVTLRGDTMVIQP